MFSIEIGTHVKCVITGFKGHVTGRAQYITGCNQYLVQPKCDKSSEVKGAHWFDEHRLNATSKEPVSVPQPEKGKEGCDSELPPVK